MARRYDGTDDEAQGSVIRFPDVAGPARTYSEPMRFAVLGTMAVVDEDGGPRGLAGPARRRLLAALLARVGTVVPVDTLIEDLWSDTPPPTAEKTLQSHVVRLRDALGRDEHGSPLVTESTGYLLDVPPESLDSWCFERDLEAGRRALKAGDPESALPLLDQALSWWRGEAYAEFPDATFAVAERLRLTELRALALESQADARLDLGEGGELVAGLERRVRDEPYRERYWEQLVVALYRSGRQADALAAYRRARRLLRDDLGLEPRPSLRLLEQRVLDQDPTLLPDRHPTVTVLGAGPATEGAAALADPVPRAGTGGVSDGLAIAAAVVPECPYRGLAAYDEDDAASFVGRERLTAELAGRLVDGDFVVVVGPSGAGKSSLLRAGLVPALRGGAIPGSAAWRIQVTTPDRLPELLGSGAGFDVLVVDQGEELFTLLGEADRRIAVRHLTATLASGTRLVLALRADFYGRLTELDALTRRVGAATVLVGPMTEDETRRVIVDPARGHGVSVSAGLVERVVADIHGRSGALPLLSAALEQTWQGRTGDRLTEDAYLRGGGVDGVLEAMGEKAFDELDAEGRDAARRLLLRLTTRAGDTWARRPLSSADAVLGGSEAARRALDVLARRRLVTTDATHVELAHEALLTGWPRLSTWLAERAVVASQLEHLAASTVTWEQDDRSDADLLRGPRLQAALDWAERHPEDLTGPEHEFLAASRAAVDAELRAQRARADREARQRRRLRAALVGTVALLVVSLVAGTIAVEQRTAAADARRVALARQIAAQSQSAPALDQALLLALAARRLDDSATSRAALFAALTRAPAALHLVQVGADRLHGAAVSGDGRVVVVAQADRLLSYGLDGRPVAVPQSVATDGVALVSARPTTDEVVVSGVSDQHLQTPVTLRWDAGRDRVIGYLAGPTAPIASFAWSPDGRVLAGAQDVGDVLVWDMTRPGASPVHIPGDANRFRQVAYAGLGRFAVVEANGTVRVWRPGARTPVARFESGGDVTAVAATPDGRVLAIGHASGLVGLWSADGRLLRPIATGVAAVGSLAFTANGATLLAGSGDGSVRTFETATGAAGPTYAGHHDAVRSIAVTQDGRTMVTTSADQTLIMWDLTGTRGFGPVLAGSAGDGGGTLEMSSRGEIAQVRSVQAVSGGTLSTIRFWAAGGAPLGSVPVPGDAGVVDARWSPDGRTLALAMDDSTVRLWDGDRPRQRASLSTVPGWQVTDVGFSPDGRTIAATLWNSELSRQRRPDAELALYDAATYAPTRDAIPVESDAGTLRWSPDGTSVSIASWSSPGLQLVDVATGRIRWTAGIDALPQEWSPDGRTIAAGASGDGTVRLIDSATGAVTFTSVQQVGPIDTIAYSADGRWLASAGEDGTAVPVDVADGLVSGPKIEALAGQSAAAAFTPSDDLVVQSGDGALRVWTLDEATWAADACALAGHDLGQAAWDALGTGLPRPSLCPA